MSNTQLEIHGALQSAIIALGELPVDSPPDPYIADAKSFATQAGVCLEKSLASDGIVIEKPVAEIEFPELPVQEEYVPPPLPEPPPAAKETKRDRNKTA